MSSWASNLEYNVGTNIKINCHAIGNPTPEFTWTKNKISFRNGAQLIISDVQKKHEGRYECVAFNKHGMDASGAISIAVIGMYAIRSR